MGSFRSGCDAATIQRHVGVSSGVVCFTVAVTNILNYTLHRGATLVEAILSPSPIVVLIAGPVLIWSGLSKAGIAQTLQVAMFIFVGVATNLDADLGNLTGGLLLGFSYLLMLEFGLLNRGAVWKSASLIAVYVASFGVAHSIVHPTSFWGIVTTFQGAAVLLYIAVVLARVRFQRHKDREQELERAVQERTTTIQARMEEMQLLKAELEQSLREKNLLLKEVHHRTKNNMQLVSSVLNLETRRIADPSAVAAMTDGIHRVRTLAVAHEHLYASEDLQHVDLATYTRALLDDIWESVAAETAELRISFEDSVEVDQDFAISFGLVMNELVSNAAKHGVKDAGEVRVEANFRNGTLFVTVEDDGPGIAEEIDLNSPRTMGLRLVAGLVEQLEGNVSVRNENGATWELAFPMHAASAT